MNRRTKQDPNNKIVCFCYGVTEQTIVQAIEGGCRSLMDVRRQTCASTGCAGCSEEVKKLLRKHSKDVSSSNSGESSDG